eukprot:g3442.t1
MPPAADNANASVNSSPGDEFLYGRLVAERQKIQLSLERRKRKEEQTRKRERGFETHINGANEERLQHHRQQSQRDTRNRLRGVGVSGRGVLPSLAGLGMLAEQEPPAAMDAHDARRAPGGACAVTTGDEEVLDAEEDDEEDDPTYEEDFNDLDEEVGQVLAPESDEKENVDAMLDRDVVDVLTMLETAPSDALEKVRASLRLRQSRRLPTDGHSAEQFRPPSALRRSSEGVRDDGIAIDSELPKAVKQNTSAQQPRITANASAPTSQGPQAVVQRVPNFVSGGSSSSTTPAHLLPPHAPSRPRSRMSQVHVDYVELQPRGPEAATTAGNLDEVAPAAASTPRLRSWSTASQTDELVSRIELLDDAKQRALSRLLDDWNAAYEDNCETMEQKWTWDGGGDGGGAAVVVEQRQSSRAETDGGDGAVLEYGPCMSKKGGKGPDAVVPIGSSTSGAAAARNGRRGGGDDSGRAVGGSSASGSAAGAGNGQQGADGRNKNAAGGDPETAQTEMEDDGPLQQSDRKVHVTVEVLRNYGAPHECEISNLAVMAGPRAGAEVACPVVLSTAQCTGLTEGANSVHRLFSSTTSANAAANGTSTSPSSLTRPSSTSRPASRPFSASTATRVWRCRTAAASGSFSLRFEALVPGHCRAQKISLLVQNGAGQAAICDLDAAVIASGSSQNGGDGSGGRNPTTTACSTQLNDTSETVLHLRGSLRDARINGVDLRADSSGQDRFVVPLECAQHSSDTRSGLTGRADSSEQMNASHGSTGGDGIMRRRGQGESGSAPIWLQNSNTRQQVESGLRGPVLLEGAGRATPADSTRNRSSPEDEQVAPSNPNGNAEDEDEDALDLPGNFNSTTKYESSALKPGSSPSNTLLNDSPGKASYVSTSNSESRKAHGATSDKQLMDSFNALEKFSSSASRKFFESSAAKAAYDLGFDELDVVGEGEGGDGDNALDEGLEVSFGGRASGPTGGESESKAAARPNRQRWNVGGPSSGVRGGTTTGGAEEAKLRRQKSSSSSSSGDEEFGHLKKAPARGGGEPSFVEPSQEENAAAQMHAQETCSNYTSQQEQQLHQQAYSHAVSCVGASLLPEDLPLFAMPSLPKGQMLIFNCASTWGDSDFIGLAGIEIFDSEGQLVVLKDVANQVAAECINVLPDYSNDPRTADKLFDQVNLTRDDFHVWLCPFNAGKPHVVMVDMGCEVEIAMIRLWNYNNPIFVGEIRQAPGDVTKPEQVCEHLLFVTEQHEDILEKIEERDWLPRVVPEIGDPEFNFDSSDDVEFNGFSATSSGDENAPLDEDALQDKLVRIVAASSGEENYDYPNRPATGEIRKNDREASDREASGVYALQLSPAGHTHNAVVKEGSHAAERQLVTKTADPRPR